MTWLDGAFRGAFFLLFPSGGKAANDAFSAVFEDAPGKSRTSFVNYAELHVKQGACLRPTTVQEELVRLSAATTTPETFDPTFRPIRGSVSTPNRVYA